MPPPLTPSPADLEAGRAQLQELQTRMAAALFRPLTSTDGMQPHTADGRDMSEVAASFIKPNDRLTSFERLEIYNRGYWFRVLDGLYDDYPGLRAVLGERKFMRLMTAYLARHPSRSFTLRDLGQHLEEFLRAEPQWTAPRAALALAMARFEWAQILAFDEGALPAITPDDLLDSPPGELRLALQPYMSLLELDFAVDEFLLAVKKRDSAVLRSEASNAIATMPGAGSPSPKRRLRLPKPAHIHLAVHRHDNLLYYKRLEPAAFAILTAIARGDTLAEACAEAIANDSKRSQPQWPAQISAWFANWTELGWFCRRLAPEQ